VFAARTVVVALLVGTLVTVLAGLVPALRATRVAPVTALRDAEPGARRAGLVARVVRPVVSLLGRPAERLGGVAGGLARRNAMRQPGRTAATATALMVGVALVTLVAVLAQGLRDTTSGSLERRVAATHVVTGEDGWSPTDDDSARAVAAVPGVRDVGTIRQDVGAAFGGKERVNALDPGAQRMVRFDWADGSPAPASLRRDEAIVDDGWATEHGLAPGERFSVTAASGERLSLVIRGIETSPVIDGLDMGPITISRTAFDTAFASERNLLTLVDAPGAGVALERALAGFPDVQAQTKEAFVDARLSDIDTLMAIFAVLLALAVIVSLFGIVNALVLATFERRREIGMLQAVGMTRRQIRRMVRHESVVTALLGAAGGIAAGLALGAAVTSALSDEGLSFAVPAGQLVVLAVVAVGCGVAAAVLPARRAARLSPLSALQYE
jgi:putative ABC transport system permease protein